MKELVEGLYLGDFVVKDRDNFLVLFSGGIRRMWGRRGDKER